MMKILVIEDESILRKEVSRWLSLEAYDVIGAGDGLEGVELAIQEKPELILCDIALPGQDGYEVMLAIRANPQTQLIPFIYMTAKASHDDIRKGMSLGADDYITKPFTRAELLQAVESVLAKRILQEQHHQLELGQWRELLKLEQEQRIFKAKLIGMFSHDFRNPLASIMSSNGILRNYSTRMDDSQREVHFNRIDSSVHRLMQMLEDMLVVAQIESGNLSFQPASIDIASFVREIIEEFQFISANSHKFTFNQDFTGIIMADARLLRQIVSNLISNAIKYSPQGSNVIVSLEPLDEGIKLIVQDFGIGIPEAEQASLFTAFQRASNVGKVAGTGLGLAIVHQAVSLHGGSIQLESQLGEGTCISVSLPGT